MKKLLFLFALMLMSITTYATPQEVEYIYIDGVKWILEQKLITADTSLHNSLRASLPEDHIIRSSNWEGYKAYWSIQQERLCLDSVRYYKDTEVCLPSDILLRVFSKHIDGNRIVATWLNEDIRVGSGKVIHGGSYEAYGSTYENEKIISIDHGKVTGMQTYHNYIVEGFSFEGLNREDVMKLREMFPLPLEQYPKLEGVDKIIFNITQARIDSTGHMVECEVKVVQPEGAEYLAKEMEKALKAYHPWRVLFINGECSDKGIARWTFPYFLDNKE